MSYPIRLAADLVRRFFILGLALTALQAQAADPASGTLTPDNPEITYTAGPFTDLNTSGVLGDYKCDDSNPCDTFALTVDLPAGYLAAHPNGRVKVDMSFGPPGSDIDMIVFDASGNKVNDSRGGPPGTTERIVFASGECALNYTVALAAAEPATDATVTITLFDDTDNLAGPPADDICNPSGGGDGSGPIPPQPVPPPAPGQPRYTQLTSPAGIGDETSGEFNIGFNPASGRFLALASLQTMRITMAEDLADEAEPPLKLPEDCPALWEDVSFVATTAQSFDPILSTDTETGRTFISQLTGDPLGDSIYAYSDDDGDNWTPGTRTSDGATDHQSIVSGPYHEGYGPSGAYPHMVLYCSQGTTTNDNAFIGCSRSDDGGQTFGAPILAALGSRDCPGNNAQFIHGHIRYGADGTIYVPVNNCSGHQAVMVSDDSGHSFHMAINPDSTPGNGLMHNAVAVSQDGGTVYECFVNADGQVHVAKTVDKGVTWTDDHDVSTPAGLAQGVFVTAVAGDPDRMTCGFIGTTTPGNYAALDFPGIWYMYMATTYDGGKTWQTILASPGNPVQGVGGVCTLGTTACLSPAHRNLLDFNEMVMDERGYPVVGYDDGCIGVCDVDPVNAVTYVAKASIVRQIGGKGMFAALDAAEPTVPHRACLSGSRTKNFARLTWKAPDSGGNAVSGYKIYRGDSPASVTELASVGDVTTFDDSTAESGTPYYYKIAAINGTGTSDKSNVLFLEPSDVVPETPCALPGVTVMEDATGDSTAPAAPYDLERVQVSEPEDQPGKIAIIVKVGSLSPTPPNAMWAVRFRTPVPPANGDDYWFVGYETAGGGSRFVYGSSTLQGAVATTVTTFTILGDLDPASTIADDGTITLIADKSIFGVNPGDFLADMTATSRAITNDQSVIAGGAQDDISGGGYQIVAADFCANGGVVTPPVDGPPVLPPVTVTNSRFGGALDLTLLFPLLGLAALRRRFAAALAILAALVAPAALAADPASGTISDASPELTYTAGPFLVRNPSAGAIVTDEQCNAALPCDDFELTIDLSPEYAASHPEDVVLMQWRWDDPFEDYDFRVFDADGNEVTSAGSASDPENAQIGAINGKYTIRGIPFTVFGGSFTATLKLASPVEAPVPPLPAGLAPEYSTGGPPDGVGDGEGEPSIGYNPKTRKVMFYGASAQTLRGTFPEELAEPLPDSCDLGWEDVSSLYTGTVSSVVGADPILFTDQNTGRTFVSNLQIPIPVPPTALGLNSQFEYTDDDGATWIPAQIGPPEGGYDHQTVGSGPYPASLSMLANPVNGGSAVYYCSQAGFTAFCSRSDDGGLTFPNGFPIYNAETDGFGGIHGHVKVAPDGSVYVPVKACGDTQCVTESDDGGVTWEVRHVPDATPGPSDPSVGIATDGTVYFCYVNGDGHPHVTISRDKGLTWTDDFDVGAAQHIKNTVFPEAVAGDPDRAACAFVGTDKGGNWQALDFPGIWYGYIATTYDAGQSWHTVNVTPDAPVQRESGIWLGGGSHDQRNLLDFNEITMDEHGRVLFGFADGCVGDCETGAASNSFTAKTRVTRQIGGKGLLAQFDPPAPVTPGGACLSGKRDPLAAHLLWRLPSSGGAQITSYRIYRGTAKGDETLLTTTTDAKARFDDVTADPTVEKYTYKITALNAQGEGLFSNIVELPVVAEGPAETSCVLPGITLFTDGTGDNDGGVPGQDLQSVSIAEPKEMPGKIVLTMKVDDLTAPPPSTRWVTYYDAPDGSAQRYVAMVTSNGTPAFEYGSYGRDPTDTVGMYAPDGAPDDTSTYGADGTIVIVLDKAALGLNDGDKLENMSTSVRSTSAANGAGLTLDTTDGNAEYTLLGTAICDVVDVPNPGPTPQPPPAVKDSTRFGGALAVFSLLPLLGAAWRKRKRKQ